MNIYNNIDTLPLYNWNKYTITNDNNWFICDYDGRQKKESNEELNTIESELKDQYFKALGNRSFCNKMKIFAEIDWLKTKYSTCLFLLDELLFTIKIELENNNLIYLTERRILIINQLKEWNFIFPIINSFDSDFLLINQFKTVLEGIKTQINILKEDLTIDNNKEQVSLIKQMRIVELSLGYSYRLDSRKITLAEWIEDCKLAEEKSKKN